MDSIPYSAMKDRRRVALVTGASSGIGKALASELARRGYSLVMVALPGTGLEDAAEELSRTYNVDAQPLSLDLCDPLSPATVYSFCQAKNVDVQVLINCAGMGNLSLFQHSDWPELRRIMTINNIALVELTHKFLPGMTGGRGGYILNVGSLASFMGVPGKAVYSATKSFVYSFSKALRTELKHTGVQVSCLCPGGTHGARDRSHVLEKINFKGTTFIQSPESVARAGINALFSGTFRVIPGWNHQFIYLLWRVTPPAIAVMWLRKIFLKKLLEKHRPVQGGVWQTLANVSR